MRLLLGLAVLMATAGLSADDSAMPQAWFEAPETASELNIRTFSQSPMLDDRGLPPVSERLPDDPIVIYPYGENGKFGGTARITVDEAWHFINWESALTISADLRNFLPNLARDWTVSEDGRIITIFLRSGLKWSDGHPLTTDDFMFSFNHIWLDPEISPLPSRMIHGGRIARVDDLTFQYIFEDPYPLFVNLIAQFGSFMVDPKHYLKRFHPSFTDREQVEAITREKGFITWMAMLQAFRAHGVEESIDTPTLRAYRPVQRTPTMTRFERNPYYHKIDPTGKQLPYIDAIDAEDILDAAVVTSMAATGQLDFAASTLLTQDIPLLKLGERNGAIQVHIWTRLNGSDVVIVPNYNYADRKLRDLYWDRRFRHALSYAINRPEMNEIIYFGRGVPRQVTVHPTSSFYEERFAKAHIQFDPDLARSLFDELGLKDIDGDGLREYPDGEPLTITLEFMEFETPMGISLELVSNYWREVGIDLRLKQVDRSLKTARGRAGKMQMTAATADRVTDILFPLIPHWWAPISIGSDSGWNAWARYYKTDGRLGEEPPPIMKELVHYADEMRMTTQPAYRLEMGKKLLASAAENLWVIGIIGLAPHPVVVSKRLKNVLPNGFWGWDNRRTLAYHPATWYFDEE